MIAEGPLDAGDEAAKKRATRQLAGTSPKLTTQHRGLFVSAKKTACAAFVTLLFFLFLGVLLTDLELTPDVREPDHCGTCRACLDACPTDAFVAPYVLDATRCISYTTIEARGPIPESMRAEQGNWVFGCDICQEVCPWNMRERRSVPHDRAGLRERIAAREHWVRPSLLWLLELDEERWRAATRKTALRRTRYRGLMRNALVAAGNSRDRSLTDAVRRHIDGEDAMLAEHARWASERIISEAPAAIHE